MDISQTSQIRVWKHEGCRGYSTQWMDTSGSASWFRKATCSTFRTRLLLQLWEKCQWAASCSLSPGTLHEFSIPPKALQTCSSLWIHLRKHDKSFFSLSGTSAQSQFAQPGWNCQFTNSAPKHLEASGFNRSTNPIRYSRPNASVLRKASLAYFPPRHFQ